MVDDDILDIANKASLKISADNKIVDIKHKFRFGDKSLLGVFFFFFSGAFLIVAAFIKTSDTTTKVLGIVAGLSFLVFSILTLIRQFADRLTITDTEMKFRHNLKKTTILFSSSMIVKMKTEIMKIRRVGTLGSDFIIVTHYLHELNNEIPILKFQMKTLYKDNAIKLGNEITRMINEKISQ